MLTRLGILAIAITTAVVLAPLQPASAGWSTRGAGAAAQRALSMPASSAPTVVGIDLSPAGRTFTLTWPTTELHGGRPVTGYRITRNSTLGGALLTVGSCVGLTTAENMTSVYVPANPGATQQSCTDVSLVNLGTVRYTVTPVYARWTGSASPASVPTS